ncbi:SUF system Fe-S cluster assembly regulator [Wenzhouxiangella limi]|uniref:SUF system Fe-S cluster assembly regulator n=1 Tax=Wenzhouxiangella limi TaxID=2707351 RepID=A0A845V5W3_9GAMM|nr:SUF system Fe-S cluster assembly regulator [Wenzhouxiangella limi]NDY96566.1 SUF system Fe-S cluster assembly regulator [Wenzhouxiangella limi]
MLRISKLTDYATVLLAALAQREENCVPASQLAEETRLELPTAAKVLKTLAKSGLVRSVRGVNGGYQLVRSPDQTSVAAIVRAMEGPIALTECSLEPGLCAHESQCTLRGNWQRIGQAVEQALERLTLRDLYQPLGSDPAVTPVATFKIM